MKKQIKFLRNGFKNTLDILLSGFNREFSSENSLINEDILEIINNPNDKKKLDDTVDFLLNHKTIKQKDVELSNKKITISLG